MSVTPTLWQLQRRQEGEDGGGHPGKRVCVEKLRTPVNNQYINIFHSIFYWWNLVWRFWCWEKSNDLVCHLQHIVFLKNTKILVIKCLDMKTSNWHKNAGSASWFIAGKLTRKFLECCLGSEIWYRRCCI